MNNKSTIIYCFAANLVLILLMKLLKFQEYPGTFVLLWLFTLGVNLYTYWNILGNFSTARYQELMEITGSTECEAIKMVALLKTSNDQVRTSYERERLGITTRPAVGPPPIPQQISHAPGESGNPGVEHALQTLQAMKAKDLISAEEFQEKRREILARL